MTRRVWLLPLLAVAAVFVLRLAGPPDLLDNDQRRPIDYILDAAADGNWLVQRDAFGWIASKPPVYTWLAAGSSLAFGGNRFALYLPCFLAMAAVAAVAALLAHRRLGWSAGLAAGMAVALASDTGKAVALARTDAVFAAAVAGAAWLALRAWESGRGWIVFWLAAAVVCLSKSPVGVLFAAGGLLAACWRSDRPALPGASTAWQHAVGLPLMLTIAAGWMLLAIESLGLPVAERLLDRELLGHALVNDKGAPVWKSFPQPVLWYLGLFAPFSLLATVSLWRLWRHPPASARRRRFLRFMACWLGVGLALLCLASHKRMILALPLLLPGAVLAGAEAARWLGRLPRRRQLALWAGATSLLLVGLALYYANRDPVRNRLDDTRAVIAAGENLGRLAARGIAVSWQREIPATIRYYVPGWPSGVDAAQDFLALPGPGAVAVMAVGSATIGRNIPLAPGIVALLDDEAAALLP